MICVQGFRYRDGNTGPGQHALERAPACAVGRRLRLRRHAAAAAALLNFLRPGFSGKVGRCSSASALPLGVAGPAAHLLQGSTTRRRFRSAAGAGCRAAYQPGYLA